MFDITTGTEDFIANGVDQPQLLRPTHARVPRLLRRPRLRDQDPGQGGRAGAAAQGAGEQELGAAGSCMSGVTDPYQPIERKLAHHATVPRGAGRGPQPGRRDHQEPPRHARHRSAGRLADARGRRGPPLDPDARPRARPRAGAARVDTEAASAGDRDARRRRHPGRGHGGAGDPGAHRSRDPADPRQRRRRRRGERGLGHAAASRSGSRTSSRRGCARIGPSARSACWRVCATSATASSTTPNSARAGEARAATPSS